MYPFIGQQLTGIYSSTVEWKALRTHYERLFMEAKTRGETQETVAARGGLRQNKISKLLSIENLGPQVETFVRAVEGLGMSPSSFFAQIEGVSAPGVPAHEPVSPQASTDEAVPTLTPDDRAIYRALGKIFAAHADRENASETRARREPAPAARDRAAHAHARPRRNHPGNARRKARSRKRS